MIKKKSRYIALLLLWLLVIGGTAGVWTSNQFIYKPGMGARGEAEKSFFDSGLDLVDARLAKEVWVGDPNYGPTLQNAIAGIGSNNVILRISAGTQNISANLTIPANITLKPERGAIFAIADGKTLTINGGLEAGSYQIFSCTGTGRVVSGTGSLRQVNAHWFGVSDTNANNAPAFNKAFEAANSRGVVSFGKGFYPITESIMIPAGNSNVTLKGENSYSVITSSSNITMIDINSAPYFTISDLKITGNNTQTSQIGINIANSSNGTIKDVFLQNIGGTLLKSDTCYLWNFIRVLFNAGSAGSPGQLLKVLSTSTHHYFESCAFNKSSYAGYAMEVSGTGHTFNHCDIEFNTAASGALLLGSGAAAEQVRLLNCWIADNSGTNTIEISGAANTTAAVENCVITAPSGTAISYLIKVVQGKCNKIYGNTFRTDHSPPATLIYLGASQSNAYIAFNRNLSSVPTAYIENPTNGSPTLLHAFDVAAFDDFVDKRVDLSGAVGTDGVLTAKVAGDTNSRGYFRADGRLEWGDGSAVRDVSFYRSGVGLLRSDGKLIADAGLGVGNSAPGDVTGTSKTKKLQVFDSTGASIGYLQVYAGP